MGIDYGSGMMRMRGTGVIIGIFSGGAIYEEDLCKVCGDRDLFLDDDNGGDVMQYQLMVRTYTNMYERVQEVSTSHWRREKASRII